MTYREHMNASAKRYLEEALAEAGTVVAAAKLSGMSRTNFYKLMDRHGIDHGKQSRTPNKGNAEWQALGR